MKVQHGNMTMARHIAALKRIRALIAGGVPCGAVDSDTPGDKYTECNWGLCNGTKEAWPDAEDHIWPDQFKDGGRVSPMGHPGPCPLQAYVSKTHGCFYQCRIFSKKRKNRPDRERVLALYDAEISRLEAHLGENG